MHGCVHICLCVCLCVSVCIYVLGAHIGTCEESEDGYPDFVLFCYLVGRGHQIQAISLAHKCSCQPHFRDSYSGIIKDHILRVTTVQVPAHSPCVSDSEGVRDTLGSVSSICSALLTNKRFELFTTLTLHTDTGFKSIILLSPPCLFSSTIQLSLPYSPFPHSFVMLYLV